MSTYLEGLKNELGYLRQQPNVDKDRVSQVEDAIKAEEAKNPAEAPPVVETMEAPAVETAVAAKPKRRTK